MSDPFFGELYLRSTRPFLSAQTTETEAQFLRSRLPADGLVLDLGCGHGRHLARIPSAIGVDGDQGSLVEAHRHAAVARADLRRLPFRAGAFRGVYCWYNSLGTFEDGDVPKILAELARITEPGATVIIQGTNVARSRAQPEASYDGPIGEGDHLREWASFNADKRRDELKRELTLGDGRRLEAEFFIRYYEVGEWQALFRDAGFTLAWCMGALDGSPIDDASPDVIVGAERRGP